MIIGLSGVGQSGKDTIGKMLVEHYGYKRLAFADTLREAAYALDPMIMTDNEEIVWLTYLVDLVGWERAKLENMQVRRLLQRLGTEVGRNVLGEDIWVDATFDKMDTDSDYVITDVRFPNEANAIMDVGAVVRVERDSAGLKDEAALHPSETALDDWVFDHVVLNNGSLEDLRKEVDFMVQSL